MSARRTRRARGFTLIELLVALALTTVGLVGLVALQTIAIRGNMTSRNFGEAIGIAQQRIESAERTPYNLLSAMLPADPACSTSSDPCAAGTINVSPTKDVTVSSTDPSFAQAVYARCTTVTDNGDGTTTVLVRVCWPDLDPTHLAHHIDLMTRRSP